MIKNENVEGEPAYDETYRRGPVVMRGPMIPKDNTYANLLAPEDSTDWLHADPWRVLRIQAEFVDGFGALAELGPAVTIFGSARTPKTDPLYKAARTVGRKIAQRGVAVITGGGPGIMGTEYWQGLFDWLNGPVMDAGMISPLDPDLVHITDDLNEAVDIALSGLM